MRSDQARTISIPAYLEQRGIKPARQRAGGGQFWYSSPIRRGDRNPSFKVDIGLNLWYDHGVDRGGNIIDLVVEMNQCSVRDALSMLDKSGLYSGIQGTVRRVLPSEWPGNARINQAPISPSTETPKSTSLKLLAQRPIQHPALVQYLESRGINVQLAKQYVSEIDFKGPRSASSYFALGFTAGNGFEARSAVFKGFVGAAKSFSLHQAGRPRRLVVFEGFMDFLTYLSVKGGLRADTSALVLNSGNLKTRALPELVKPIYSEIQLFLDNDAMGDTTTQYFVEHVPGVHVIDMRSHYAEHNDLNAWHLSRQD